MLLSVPIPDFSPNKMRIAEENEWGALHLHIFSLDTSKQNFVDKIPSDFIDDELNN